MARYVFLCALAAFAAPLAAQDSAPRDRHPVSPQNLWSITDSDCAIDSGWDDGTQILITLHDDHHDLGIYNNGFKGVVPEKVIPVRFAAGEHAIDGRAYQALGHRDAESTSYVSDVDDALLDAVAAAGSIQFYRGRQLLVDLATDGFPEALQAMRACEAMHPPAQDEGMVDPDGYGPDPSGGAYGDDTGNGGAATQYQSDVT